MANSPKVLIYREQLLPPSETFILQQIRNLSRYDSHLVGIERVDGLPLKGLNASFIGTPGLLNIPQRAIYRTLGLNHRLTSLLRTNNFRLAHAHFGTDGAQILPAAVRRDLPLVVTYHGYDATTELKAIAAASLKGRMYCHRRTRLHSYCALILAVSDHIRERLLHQGVDDRKIRRHYIGIDTKTFAPRLETMVNSEVLFIGRLVAVKGCEHLIRALHKLATASHVKATVLGDGPLRKPLEQLARDLRVHITFEGNVPPERVREKIAECRVLCVPSITGPNGQQEAFGLASIEAQAMGTPVVGYASGGVPEAIAHGDTGYLVTEGDIDGLAYHLRRVLTDDQIYRAMSDRSREWVVRRFDLAKQTRALEDLYDEAVSLRGARN